MPEKKSRVSKKVLDEIDADTARIKDEVSARHKAARYPCWLLARARTAEHDVSGHTPCPVCYPNGWPTLENLGAGKAPAVPFEYVGKSPSDEQGASIAWVIENVKRVTVEKATKEELAYWESLRNLTGVRAHLHTSDRIQEFK